MEREKLIVIILTVAVISGAFGLVLGGVFTRPARDAVDAEIAEIRADIRDRITELKAEVAAAERRRKTAIAETRQAREQTKRVVTKAARDVKTARKPRGITVKAKPKVLVVDPTIATAIQTLLNDGLVYSVDVRFNEVRIDPSIWSAVNIEVKENTVMLFSTYFEQSGSTGRVTILSNRNDTKLATYGAWGGIKILQ